MRILINPSDADVIKLIRASEMKAARRIVDRAAGIVYVWDAKEGTHADGAREAGISYDVPAGMGDILTLDEDL